MQPLYAQQGSGRKPGPVVASGPAYKEAFSRLVERASSPELAAVEQCQGFNGISVEPLAAVGSKHTVKRNIMKPQTFDGKEPVHSFLAHFEVCAKFNGWTEDDKRSLLQWSLKGRAQQLLWDLSPSQLTSYDELSRNLKQRFGSEN